MLHALILPHVLARRHRVPINLVAALVVLGPMGRSGVTMEEKLPAVLSVVAGLSGVAALIQVNQFEHSSISIPPLAPANNTS